MNYLALASAAVLAALLPAGVQAQALACALPHSLPRPHPALPTAKEPVRRVPIGGYTLALSWSPQFCRTRSGIGRTGAGSDIQCGQGNAFGFTLHGLWPDGIGKDWPQYCRAAPLLSRRVIAANLCTTPSAQLLQHEWAKHGTCMPGYSPERYFTASRALFRGLRFPDMDALSRRPALTAGMVAEAMAAANPGLRADAIRVTATRDGWLDELWLCLDRKQRFARCEQGGGVDRASAIRIWRLAR